MSMEKYYTTYATANSLSHWLQVDPLADKYPGWSPYNYCVNNPLRFVDPDGRKVWIKYKENGEEKRVEYANGELYNENGSAYTGNDEFVLGVRADFNALLSIEDERITKVIQELINSQNEHTIAFNSLDGRDQTRSKPSADEEKAKTQKGSSSIIFLGRIEGVYENGIRKTTTQTLIHELSHAYDFDKELMGDNTGKHNASNPTEIRAVQLENRYRRHSLPNELRISYDNLRINFSGKGGIYGK